MKMLHKALKKYNEYYTNILNESMDSIVVCNSVVVDRSGIMTFKSDNGSSFWLNDRIDRYEALQNGDYTKFLIYLNNHREPIRLYCK
jgi:hypothetical protein